MTPEKRPAEDEEEQEAKKLKEDSTCSGSEAPQDEEASQDSVGSDSASSSDPEKKVLAGGRFLSSCAPLPASPLCLPAAETPLRSLPYIVPHNSLLTLPYISPTCRVFLK